VHEKIQRKEIGVSKVVRRFARAIINNGKSYACTYWRIAACWAAPFYASADVVVFSASKLDGKLSSFFGKGLLRFRKSATDKILERVFMFARRECTDTALLLSRASGVFSLIGRYSFIRAS
jgi:hypothetical protein